MYWLYWLIMVCIWVWIGKHLQVADNYDNFQPLKLKYWHVGLLGLINLHLYLSIACLCALVLVLIFHYSVNYEEPKIFKNSIRILCIDTWWLKLKRFLNKDL